MPNTLQKDPTRTTLLRNLFIADMVRRFKIISREVTKLLVEDDVLGLIGNIEAEAWRFQTNPQKVKSFRRWLKQQVDTNILTTDALGKPWTATYVDSAYKRGVTHAYIEARKEFLFEPSDIFEGTKEQFLRTSFSSQEALSKIELLYERAFTELEGVTAMMDQQMSRILAAGLAEGRHPSVIARSMRETVTKLTNTRAKVIARTEVIRAHAEGQLDSYERLGVKELNIMAEWSTAGDERVCALCEELEGVVMTIKEARGLLPRHPNCRCAWIPANSKMKTSGQLWGSDKDTAIEKSIQAEAPKKLKRSPAEVRRRSVWAGKEL